MQLNPKGLAAALGIFGGAAWAIAMIFSFLTGVGVRTLITIGSYHPFFSYSWGGMLIMAIEHLIAGYVVGWIIAKLYNKYSR